MKIVIGVDGSEPAQRAVEWCAAHASALDAEIVAVHAIDVPVYQETVGIRLPVPPPSPEYRAEPREYIETVWCAPLATANARYRVVLKDGDPADAIIQWRRRNKQISS